MNTITFRYLLLSALSGALCAGCNDQDHGRKLVNAVGSTNELISLLANGGDINERSSAMFGWTPLISAIYHHKQEAVDLLLEKGADVNIADRDGQTALIWSIEMWGENTNLIHALLDRGANPASTNRFGSNAYDMARKQTNADELLRLLKGGQTYMPTNAGAVSRGK